jgi:hypothetical protein
MGGVNSGKAGHSVPLAVNNQLCVVINFELHFARIVQEIKENPGDLTDSHSTIKHWLLIYGVSLAFCVCTLVEDQPRTLLLPGLNWTSTQ